MFKNLIPLIATLVFFSCEKEIPFTAEEQDPRIVVNGIFTEDSTWKLQISESRSVLSNDDLPYIENADITLKKSNGEVLGDFIYLSYGNYILNTPLPVVNEMYSLDVSAPGFPSVKAKSSVPTPLTEVIIDTAYSDYDYKMQIDLSFDDDGTTEDYYAVMISNGSYYEFEGDTALYENFGFYTIEPYVVNGDKEFDSNEKYSNIFFFDDKIHNGKKITFRGKTDYMHPSYSEGFYKITVIKYSEEVYKYLVTLDKHRSVSGNVFAEPVQVFSNISDGFGIFGGQTKSIHTIIIE
ncbi:DUF4249 domain-containing protein [Crocinitomix algicola]|uniref:DUF4249 domain-containing protein n=1 Tax=Crocinitomix algicola TaxID=1740263 RepID=UPI000872126B|nr:DUF4249 domain-containing protein [Crocinitomix algicola]